MATLSLRRFTRLTANKSRYSYRQLHQIPFLKTAPKSQKIKMASTAAENSTQTEDSPLPQFLQEYIKSSMKYKERSHQTLEQIHRPALEAIPQDPTQPAFDVIFIGDSMIERLKTTGQKTNLHNFPRSFNLGVGGDKIENVLYRLHTGYIPLLAQRSTKLWVVHIGTNNLRMKKGLRDTEPSDYWNFRVLIQTLWYLSPGSKILVTGIFRRKDIGDKLIETANEKLKENLEELSKDPTSMTRTSLPELEPDNTTFFWQEPDEAIGFDVLEDHAHLNKEGYRLWDESIYPRVLEILALGESKPSQE
ncbi:hypothetical protein TWF481_006127 [Arthrobotrys musiformis]|uniref:SGNH hydrolase-type esterase domain-containing protein n=1 Tax=Arthrobotrys musiformis TaxID=47236 RepID=A0AAV9WH66_9PEZI